MLAAGDVVAGPDATTVRPATLRPFLALYVFDTFSDPGFCDLFVGKAMNSDASANEECGPTQHDQIIQDEFFDSSD
jgi:hypothetical protein